MGFENTHSASSSMLQLNASQKAVKEKNRKAQKRFRERQKAKMRGLEKSVEEQTTENESLRKQVEEMMEEGRDICLHTAVTQPLRSKRLVMCNLEDIQNHGLSVQCCMSGGWESVLVALDLSPNQRTTIITLREEFINKSKVLLYERQQINQRLKQTIPAKPELWFISLAGLHAADCLCDLKENLQKEHQAHLEFMASVLKDTLGLYQLATASVCSYPCFPDALAIANRLVMEEDCEIDNWQDVNQS